MSQLSKKLVLIDSLYDQYDLAHRSFSGTVFKSMVKCRTTNMLYRALRKAHLSSPLIGKKAWLGDWCNDLEEVNTIILADGGNSENVARYIHSLYPDKRIIIWYRNSVEFTGKPSNDIVDICEIWSFDQADCKRYGYRFNPQFYGGNSAYQTRDTEWDVFFIGQDKGRLTQLLEIEERLTKIGLITKFCIVGYNSDYLSYEKVIEYISRTRSILDVQAEWQDGITLRPLEALFYSKKLITNSKAFSESELYYAPNTFLVGIDDWTDIATFARKPYSIPENHDYLMRKYGIEGWLERFDEEFDTSEGTVK